jgi:hypothetical protein
MHGMMNQQQMNTLTPINNTRGGGIIMDGDHDDFEGPNGSIGPGIGQNSIMSPFRGVGEDFPNNMRYIIT